VVIGATEAGEPVETEGLEPLAEEGEVEGGFAYRWHGWVL